MISFNERETHDHDKIASDLFFVWDLACSPTVTDLLKGYLLPAWYPSSIHENNLEFVYPQVMYSMESRWSNFSSRRFNIMMVDYIQEEAISWVIAENIKLERF